MTAEAPSRPPALIPRSAFPLPRLHERGFQNTLIDADHLLARWSHADQRDTRSERFLDPRDVATGVRGQIGERADVAGIGLPAVQGLVDRGDPRPLAFAGGRRVDGNAIGEVAGAEAYFRQGVEDVEAGQGDAGDGVESHDIAPDDGVEP